MGILVDNKTKLLVQGITGKAGSHHTMTMLEYGTNIVGGVRPGAGGQDVQGIPVYNTVKDAIENTGANASIIFVPAAGAKTASLEAINSGIKLLVIPPEHIPIHDVMDILDLAKDMGVTVVGPNTPGFIEPNEKCKIGFVPNKYFIPGNVGIASRSGTLLYELSAILTANKIGQSMCIGVGGDPIVGMRFKDVLERFEKDENTKSILLIGEIGGSQEEEAAELVRTGKVTKPVISYIAGQFAPEGEKMGHAGAIIYGSSGTMKSKLDAFAEAGIKVASTLKEVPNLLSNIM